MMLVFYGLLLENLPEFLVLLAATLCGVYLLFRRHVFSVFDPLLYYAVVTEAFCIADVVFLHRVDLIEQKYLVNYLLTEAAFFAGILQFKPTRPAPDPAEPGPIPGSLQIAYRASLLLLVLLNLLVYTQRGIPLLAESRLEIYAVGGGWGFVARLFDVLLIIVLYYLLEVLRRRSWGIGDWLALLAVLVIQVLSGAKSAVLTVVFVVAVHAFMTGAWSRPDAPSRRLLKGLAVAAVSGFILVAAVQKSDLEVAGIEVPLLGQAAMRFIANGDAFVYSYPDGFVEQLDGTRSFAAVAKEYLAFFRLYPPEQLPAHLGVQISVGHGGGDVMTQTNAKHNLFGYVYFGSLGSILFSFLVGTCIGGARYKILGWTSGKWIWGVAYILLNVAFAGAGSDWDSTSRSVIDLLIFVLPLAAILEWVDRRGGDPGASAVPSSTTA
jgi:hypothetical protein